MATEKHQVQLQRWKLLIQDRMNSNLKILDWCNKNNVSKDAYYYWLKQIRKEAVKEASSRLSKPITAESNSFVEIQPVISSVIASEVNTTKASAIIRGKDFEIELLDNASRDFIRKLMEAIKYA